MEKKIDIGKNGKVKIIWNVSPLDYTKENEKNIKVLFAEKYGIPQNNIYIEKNFKKLTTDSTALNADNIKEITDPNFHYKLYQDYLHQNEIKDYDWEAICSIDSMVNNQIDFDKYEKGKRYTVKWLDWSNFLSYGQTNHFDFTQLHGLVLLNGEPANKSGKSTFAYDLLHFLFFGETHSGKADNLAELFNIHLPDETELKVEGCINIDGTDYIIKRTLKRAAKSKKQLRTATQKIEYYRINEVGEQEELADIDNLQEESTTKTNKVIKEAIGNEDDFDMIISANAKDLDELISLKTTDRGRILSRWIGLSCLEDKNTVAREIWNKKISVGRYCDIYNRETVANEIETLKENIKTNKENISENNKKITEIGKTINRYNEDITRYISERKTIDTSINVNDDITTLESKKAEITESGKKDSEVKAQYQKQVDEIKDYEFSETEYKELILKKEDKVSKIATIKANIESLKEKNKQLKSSEVCPTCGRPFEGIDNSGLIEENKKTIQDKIQEGIKLDEERKSIVAEIEKMDVRRENGKQRNSLELKISALEVKLANKRNELKDINDKIKKYNANKEAIKFNNELDAKINTARESIKIEESVKLRLSNENVSSNKEIETDETSINEKEAIIVKIKNEEKIEKDWKLYLELIGKNGVSKMVLRNSLPIINAELDRLLSDVSDFSVEVMVNDKNDVNFIMERNDKKCRLSAASGLEKTQAALALRVVLGKMSMLSKPPFIVLDEVLGGVAKENYEDMKKLYDKVVSEYEFVLHICHLPEWVDYHDQIVTVTKNKDNISSIKTVL